jgi:hypothetical protein
MTTESANERLLLADLEAHLKTVWLQILTEWQASVKAVNVKKKAVALVTRRCEDCETTVRVGAILNRLSPHAPAGDRAYCAACMCVTRSPIIEIRGLVVRNREGNND